MGEQDENTEYYTHACDSMWVNRMGTLNTALTHDDSMWVKHVNTMLTRDDSMWVNR